MWAAGQSLTGAPRGRAQSVGFNAPNSNYNELLSQPSGTGGVATPEGRKGSGMRQVSKSQVRDGPGWSSQEDVRRLEGTLATLNEKVDSIHSHWSQPLEGVRAGVQELASNMAGLVATVQTTLAAQQALMAKVSLQQETLANVRKTHAPLHVCESASAFVVLIG